MRIIVLAAFALAAWSCASDRKLPEGIPPEKRDWYGEFYNLEEYAKCRTQVERNNLACEYLRLTRQEEPEYWPYPDVPRPKLPAPPNPPVYREGMSSKEYFDALCKAEAGEFIYKVVESVEGVYQIRPRKRVSSNALSDRFVIEDPYGHTDWEAQDPATLFVRGSFAGYGFFEAPPRQRVVSFYEAKRFDPSILAAPPQDARVERFYGYDGKDQRTMRKEFDSALRSKYGFLWRGIERPKDRGLAIAGGELLVVDLKTNEVLGVRRGFARSGFVRNSRSGIQWEIAEFCPRLRRQPDGGDKWPSFAYSFVSKVLRPTSRDRGNLD